jgi:hypothetical protein
MVVQMDAFFAAWEAILNFHPVLIRQTARGA